MCLAKVTKKILEPTNEVLPAWGVFKLYNDYTIGSQYFPSITPIKFNVWLKASEQTLSTFDVNYQSGFHKYRARSAAAEHANYLQIAIPVQLRKVRTLGIQEEHVVYVADEMKVLKKDVVEAVAAGKFHIYPVQNIDQGIEILTSVAAGEKGKDGTYPAGTVNHLVDQKLGELARRMKEFEAGEKN